MLSPPGHLMVYPYCRCSSKSRELSAVSHCCTKQSLHWTCWPSHSKTTTISLVTKPEWYGINKVAWTTEGTFLLDVCTGQTFSTNSVDSDHTKSNTFFFHTSHWFVSSTLKVKCLHGRWLYNKMENMGRSRFTQDSLHLNIGNLRHYTAHEVDVAAEHLPSYQVPVCNTHAYKEEWPHPLHTWLLTVFKRKAGSLQSAHRTLNFPGFMSLQDPLQ